jgi:hypothetical protein
MDSICLEKKVALVFEDNAGQLFYLAKTGIFSADGEIEASILQPESELKNQKPMGFDTLPGADKYKDLIFNDVQFELSNEENLIHVFTDNYSGLSPYNLVNRLKYGYLQTILEYKNAN